MYMSDSLMETKEIKKNRALIVEDDPDICYLLTGILRQKQLESSFVNNISDAQHALQKATPDVVLLDNHLPDGLGVDFISYIKSNFPQTRVILMTAHDTGFDKTIALNNGADYFIGKPFSKAIINTTLDNLNL